MGKSSLGFYKSSCSEDCSEKIVSCLWSTIADIRLELEIPRASPKWTSTSLLMESSLLSEGRAKVMVALIVCYRERESAIFSCHTHRSPLMGTGCTYCTSPGYRQRRLPTLLCLILHGGAASFPWQMNESCVWFWNEVMVGVAAHWRKGTEEVRHEDVTICFTHALMSIPKAWSTDVRCSPGMEQQWLQWISTMVKLFD